MKEIEFSQIYELNAQHANAVRNWRAGIVLFPAEALSICYRIANQSYARRPSLCVRIRWQLYPAERLRCINFERKKDRNNFRSLANIAMGLAYRCRSREMNASGLPSGCCRSSSLFDLRGDSIWQSNKRRSVGLGPSRFTSVRSQTKASPSGLSRALAASRSASARRLPDQTPKFVLCWRPYIQRSAPSR
jgi:hypothetical protein